MWLKHRGTPGNTGGWGFIPCVEISTCGGKLRLGGRGRGKEEKERKEETEESRKNVKVAYHLDRLGLGRLPAAERRRRCCDRAGGEERAVARDEEVAERQRQPGPRAGHSIGMRAHQVGHAIGGDQHDQLVLVPSGGGYARGGEGGQIVATKGKKPTSTPTMPHLAPTSCLSRTCGPPAGVRASPMSTAVAMKTLGMAGFGVVPKDAVWAHRTAAYLNSAQISTQRRRKHANQHADQHTNHP